MKKHLLNPIFAALVVFLFSYSVFAAPVQPVRTMTFPDAIPAPTIDGTADAVYSDVQSTNVFNPTGLEGDADFSASFQVCWDPTYLYLYTEITDDVDESYSWGVGNPWEFDNIELFLQLDTNTVTTSYGPTTVQLRICRGLDSVETPGRAARSDYIYYMEGAAAGGWLCEVAIPWTAVLATGSTPEDIMNYYTDVAIGFDFSGADSDNTDGDPAVGNRDVQSAWDDDDPSDAADRTEDNAWNNTSVFGYISIVYYCKNYEGTDCFEPDALYNTREDQKTTLLPNPVQESIHFTNLEKACPIKIINMQGIEVINFIYYPSQEIDISSLQSGLYMAVIDGKESVKFIKE
jgi:hypothetical protein